MSGFEAPVYQVGASNALAFDASRWFGTGVDRIELMATRSKEVVTALYFLWSALVVAFAIIRRRGFDALTDFPRLMREHW
jgi:hypothetical protein